MRYESGDTARMLTNSPRNVHSEYFPHIDGLRAMAILPVVAYHLYPSGCPGGFAGVDVFFVISGFLITRGIVSDLNARRFSLKDFYVRRIKRILPAYFVLILCVLAILPLFYSFYRYRSVCLTGIYSALYCTNIYFCDVISYFDISAKQNPLLHLWSLGVEEQFYLIVPAVIWILWELKRGFFIASLYVLFAASLLLSTWCIRNGHSQYAFFMLPARAWELLAGSIISQMPWTYLAARPTAGPWSYVGTALIAVPYAFYNDRTPFPGLSAMPLVAGACLLILFGGQKGISKVLTSRPAVTIGKASYSLYLWHWPIFIMFGSAWSPRRAAIGLVCSAAATFLSYRFVELPIRRHRAIGDRSAFIFLAAGSTVIISFGLFITRGTDSRNGELPLVWNGVKTWVQAEDGRSPARSHCDLSDLERKDSNFLIKIGDLKTAPSFALWGDSLSLALLPGVDHVASEYHEGGFYINLKQSLTLNAEIGAYPFQPKADREPVLLWLIGRPDIVNVFLVNNWFAHLRNHDDIVELLSICRRLKTAGKRVYFFDEPPTANEKALYRLSWGMRADPGMGAVKKFDYQSESIWQSQAVKELREANVATAIPTDMAFWEGDEYETITSDESYYLDNRHLNRLGADKAMQFVAPLIWPRTGGS